MVQLALSLSLFLCSGDTDLRSFSRIFIAELQRGFFEKHVWLSMWDRPPRSRFTRVQRATCCSLLIFLFLCANAVWYGMVGNLHLRCAGPWCSGLFLTSSVSTLHFSLQRAGQTLCLLGISVLFVTLSLPFLSQRIRDQGQPYQLPPLPGFAVSFLCTAHAHFSLCPSEMPNWAILSYLATLSAPANTTLQFLLILSSNGAVSNLIPVNVDTVAVGLVSSVVVYPLYLIILFLFRMARSKVRRRSGCRWV